MTPANTFFRPIGLLALALATAIAPAPSHAQRTDLAAPRTTVAREWPGGFQAGDRIILSVDGEKQLTDTFVVRSGRVLELPVIGVVPLSGVRRADIQSYLAGVVGRYVRDPVV